MSMVREILARAQGSLLLADELNQRARVKRPLHRAMEQVDRAIKAEDSQESGKRGRGRGRAGATLKLET